MATYTKYNLFIENFANKLFDLFGAVPNTGVDTHKAVIHTDAPVPTTDNVIGDVTQIGNSNGYTTGGLDILFASTRTTDTITATATDVTWTATGGNLGGSTTGQYVSYYNDTSAADNLVASWAYGSTFTVATGETFTLDFGTTLWTLV
jgi:hypothetical protein